MFAIKKYYLSGKSPHLHRNMSSVMDLSFQLKSLSLSNNDDDTMVIYLSQLAGKENINFYKLLWPAVLMRNCDESGRFGVLAN